MQKGYNLSQITILEAQNRIGGRVNTVPYGMQIQLLYFPKKDYYKLKLIKCYRFKYHRNWRSVGAWQKRWLYASVVIFNDKWSWSVIRMGTNGVQIPDAQINQWWNVYDAIIALADKASARTNQSMGDFFVTQFDTQLFDLSAIF